QEEAPGLPPLPPRKPRTGPDSIAIAILVVGVGGLAFLGYYSSIPQLQFFEQQFTGPPHSQYYLNAIASINHAGLAGSILTDNTAADRWTRALTDRNTYDSAEPTDFVFYGSQILDDEETQFMFHNLYGVSDGRTYASVNTLNASRMDSLPSYTAWSTGVPSTVFRIPPLSLMVTVQNGSKSIMVPAFSTNRSPDLHFPNPHTAEMIFSLHTTYYNLTEIVQPHPPSFGLDFVFRISATGPANLTAFDGTLAALPGASSAHNQTPSMNLLGNSTSWEFLSRGPAGYAPLATNIVFENGSGAVNGSLPGNKLQSGVHFTARPGPTNPRVIYLTISATTPSASNLVGDVPPILSTPDIILERSARYLLMDRNSAPLVAYYTTEYHAVLLASYTDWSVYTLPVTYPPTPYGPP
ncbi:MAG: hypothetical protein L3K08_08450, partial [Thermoplasmata archaeon]|nr:hypothetical protein [Thermoplasmata archaeon]